MDTVPRVRIAQRYYDPKLGTMYRTRLDTNLPRGPTKTTTSLRGPKHRNVKIIDIGPDRPGLFRTYIWGRQSE